MGRHRWAFLPADVNVTVHDGVVHLWGVVTTEAARRAMIVAAESIAGVKTVEDHMGYPPIPIGV